MTENIFVTLRRTIAHLDGARTTLTFRRGSSIELSLGIDVPADERRIGASVAFRDEGNDYFTVKVLHSDAVPLPDGRRLDATKQVLEPFYLFALPTRSFTIPVPADWTPSETVRPERLAQAWAIVTRDCPDPLTLEVPLSGGPPVLRRPRTDRSGATLLVPVAPGEKDVPPLLDGFVRLVRSVLPPRGRIVFRDGQQPHPEDSAQEAAEIRRALLRHQG